MSSADDYQPILRWPGGKRRLTTLISSHLPSDLGTYHEPFLGAGALLFYLAPARARVGDLNADLMNFYRQIKEDPGAVHKRLLHEGSEINSAQYYEMRFRFNSSTDPLERAALFLGLNMTCFNGIWRVNRRNLFNVPFGDRGRLDRVSLSNLVDLSERLQSADLYTGDFEECLLAAKAGDFAYLDPPYIPIGPQESFSRYTDVGFILDQHKAVARVLEDLTLRNVNAAVSQSDTELVRELFAGYRFIILESRRTPRAKGAHVMLDEVLILNYDPH